MTNSDIIKTLEKQVERANLLLINPKVESRKSWRATNITLLDSLFGKNNQYSNEFQKMGYSFIFSKFGIPTGTDFEYYSDYVKTGRTILISAIDVLKSAGESIITGNKTKTSSKKSQTINVNNNNIINQTQTINIDIENSLKNELTVKQYEKLNEILQEKNSKTKGKRVLDFLKELGSETLAKIIKGILLGN